MSDRFSCLKWHPDKNADNLEVATEVEGHVPSPEPLDANTSKVDSSWIQGQPKAHRSQREPHERSLK